MDLRGYYQKVREVEATIADAFAVIVSLETSDGGKAGTQTEVTRSLAARMIVDGLAHLAKPDEKQTSKSQRATTPKANT
jgi:hypothetical protein